MTQGGNNDWMIAAWVGYGIIRAGLAAAGLFVIMGTLASYVLMPDLFYDDLPEPPPMRERLPGIASGFGIAALYLFPHRLTMRSWLYWPRMVVSVFVCLFCLWAGISGIFAGLRGGKDLAIYPVSVAFMLVGISVPGCLWLRAYLMRRSRHLAPYRERPI
jgi:hypothetical protein